MHTDTRPLAMTSPPAWLSAFETAPGWMRWSGAALLSYTLFLLTPTGLRVDGTVWSSVASLLRLCIEGTALLWAVERVDLPPRFVLSFRIAGWTSFATALNYALLLPPKFGGPTLLSTATDGALTVAGYAATLVSLLVYPRAPARAGEHAALVIDTLVTTVGLSVLGWAFVTDTSAGLAQDQVAQSLVQAFGIAQVVIIAGLNVVIVRGLAVPSPRAFWWYVSGLTLYLPVIFFTQLNAAGLAPNWPVDIAYYAGVLPTLVACHAVRTDPMTHVAHTGPSWLRDLNPLPLVMPLLVGIALLAVLVVGPAGKALPLAATLVGISMLLAARLLLSAHHTAELGRQDAAREQRRQAERLEAIGRLAGGIAHEFNNLMARVIGNTELGEASLPADAEARTHFVRARAAAVRAADLTSQLLTFSGQQATRLEMIDAEVIVHTCYNRTIRGLAAGIVPDLQRGRGPFATFADAAQLSAALGRVIDNAVEAMPDGGRLTLRVGREQLRDRLRLAQLAVPAGEYVVIAVSDTGVGMTPEAVALACDPFYSTKPGHLGAGLGLASVHGFIAAHSGGLAIESAPGLGTTVRFYLPVAHRDRAPDPPADW